MAIIRETIHLDAYFTTIPNEWLRDPRLTLKARGLLALILSHRVGWRVTVASLARTNPEGKDAINAAIRELEDNGYMQRRITHDAGGKFSGVDYILTSAPFTENPHTGADYPVTANPVTDYPVTANPHTKKNIIKEEQDKENQLEEIPQTPSAPHQPAGTVAASGRPQTEGYTSSFLQFWDAYPAKKAKGAAFKAWKRVPASEHQAVITGASFYAADPNREARFTKHPATWLNGRCWEDETPEPSRAPAQKIPGWMARDQANQAFANAYLNQGQAGGPVPLDSNWIAGELS